MGIVLEERFWIEKPVFNVPRKLRTDGIQALNLKILRERTRKISGVEPLIENSASWYFYRYQSAGAVTSANLEQKLTLTDEALQIQDCRVRIAPVNGRPLEEEYKDFVSALKNYFLSQEEDYSRNKVEANGIRLKTDLDRSTTMLIINAKNKKIELYLLDSKEAAIQVLSQIGYREDSRHRRIIKSELSSFECEGLNISFNIVRYDFLGYARVLEIRLEQFDEQKCATQEMIFSYANSLGIRNPEVTRDNGGCRETLPYRRIISGFN